MSLHQKIADDVPQIKRGLVWCRTCRREERVDGAQALRAGWPKCCGYTMTIDHPSTWEPRPVTLRRIQRRRTKGWKMPPNTVSVTRPGPWGNPYTISHQSGWWFVDGPRIATLGGIRCGNKEGAQLVAVAKFRETVDVAAVAALRGKNLACWCPLDQPCHADVLLELANAPQGGAPDDPR